MYGVLKEHWEALQIGDRTENGPENDLDKVGPIESRKTLG